jgi:peptide deformylase
VEGVWLLFKNEHGRFRLHPGESRWIEYGYSVSDSKWGNWFQRAVRLPTERLWVQLQFPGNLDPAVWGMETSMTTAAYPFRTAVEQEERDGHRVFFLATDNPPLHARYRLEWTFRARRDQEPAAVTELKPSEKMAAIGIVQEGDPILREVAQPFDLPVEVEDARRVVVELHSTIHRADTIQDFAKGPGVAAPQLGIRRSAAIVRTPQGEYITLLNPHTINESNRADVQHKGCWSFFNIRGKIPRPLSIEVEHQDISGATRITVFELGTARLVAHEIDHLHGLLYAERTANSTDLIPVTEYHGSGQPWPSV